MFFTNVLQQALTVYNNLHGECSDFDIEGGGEKEMSIRGKQRI
jgi:hypothetical protein